MVQINFAQKSVTVKIVYYGPGMSGKTTNLEVVHQRAPDASRGDLTSISTDGDRTLFFDFMPLDLGMVAGMRTQFQIYTVPGQVYYNSTRKLVLQGTDGVIFIADSSASMMQENLESLKNLEENLAEYGKDINAVPYVIQWNKRDLPDALPVEELERALNPRGVPSFEACANTGQGVFPTLKALAALVLDSIHEHSGAGSGGSSIAASPAPPAAPAAAPPGHPGAAPPVQSAGTGFYPAPQAAPRPAPNSGASMPVAPILAQPAVPTQPRPAAQTPAPIAQQAAHYPQEAAPAAQEAAHQQQEVAHQQQEVAHQQQEVAHQQQEVAHQQQQAPHQQQQVPHQQQQAPHQQQQAPHQQPGAAPAAQEPAQYPQEATPAAPAQYADAGPQVVHFQGGGGGLPSSFPQPAPIPPEASQVLQGVDSLSKTQVHAPPHLAASPGMAQAPQPMATAPAPGMQPAPAPSVLETPQAQPSGAAPAPQARYAAPPPSGQPGLHETSLRMAPRPVPEMPAAHGAQATLAMPTQAPAQQPQQQQQQPLMQVNPNTPVPPPTGHSRTMPAPGRIKPRSNALPTPKDPSARRSAVITAVFVTLALVAGIAIGGFAFNIF